MLQLAVPSGRPPGQGPDGRMSFRWERDMIPPLAESVTDLLSASKGPGAEYVLTEVPSASGVPDVVLARFDEDALAFRLAAGLLPVVDVTQVRTLVAVASGHRTVSGLAAAAGITSGYLRGSVLPALAARGWVETPTKRGGEAAVTPLHVLQPIAEQLVTVEAKKAAWQRAVNQAMRHTASADSSYIALDAARAGSAIEQRAAIRRLGVGVLVVDRITGCVRVASRPQRHRPDRAMRTVLAERAWQLVASGQTAGPTFPVFGRDLAAIGSLQQQTFPLR